MHLVHGHWAGTSAKCSLIKVSALCCKHPHPPVSSLSSKSKPDNSNRPDDVNDRQHELQPGQYHAKSMCCGLPPGRLVCQSLRVTSLAPLVQLCSCTTWISDQDMGESAWELPHCSVLTQHKLCLASISCGHSMGSSTQQQQQPQQSMHPLALCCN